tara:strand:+ start:133 stop:825 length:693 start_codon:yes stop_codon:yes gene_type:complete
MPSNETYIDYSVRPGSEEYFRYSEISRLSVTGIVLELLRNIFSKDANNVINPAIQDYYWAPEFDADMENARNQIMIEDVFSWTPDKAGQRPAVLVKGNKWIDQKASIGHRLHGNQSTDGKESFYKRVKGGHTIFVIGKTPAQTELLAREVYLYLSSFSQVIIKETCFDRWEVPTFEAVQELEEYTEHFAIPINLQYELSYTWELFPVTRLLQGVFFDLELDSDEESLING